MRTGPSPAESVAHRRAAIAEYRGDLLDGLYDDWVIGERERLRNRYLSALQQTAVQLAAVEDYAEASRFGRELLRCDPLREDTYRLLMELSNHAGDRAGAVRLFHECVSVLQDELGVEPSAATTAAFAEIMRAEHGEIPGPPLERFSGPALVGRDAELDQLLGCWRDAEQGRRQLALITGEPGIGKSRLVEELAARCTRRVSPCATARSYPTEGELGYGATIAWLRSGGFVGRHAPRRVGRSRSAPPRTGLSRRAHRHRWTP